MLYSVWDIETNNLVAEYKNRADALRLVLDAIARNGPADVNSLSLDLEDQEGIVQTFAYGPDLAELASRELEGTDRVG